MTMTAAGQVQAPEQPVQRLSSDDRTRLTHLLLLPQPIMASSPYYKPSHEALRSYVRQLVPLLLACGHSLTQIGSSSANCCHTRRNGKNKAKSHLKSSSAMLRLASFFHICLPDTVMAVCPQQTYQRQVRNITCCIENCMPTPSAEWDAFHSLIVWHSTCLRALYVSQQTDYGGIIALRLHRGRLGALLSRALITIVFYQRYTL